MNSLEGSNYNNKKRIASTEEGYGRKTTDVHRQRFEVAQMQASEDIHTETHTQLIKRCAFVDSQLSTRNRKNEGVRRWQAKKQNEID